MEAIRPFSMRPTSTVNASSRCETVARRRGQAAKERPRLSQSSRYRTRFTDSLRSEEIPLSCHRGLPHLQIPETTRFYSRPPHCMTHAQPNRLRWVRLIAEKGADCLVEVRRIAPEGTNYPKVHEQAHCKFPNRAPTVGVSGHCRLLQATDYRLPTTTYRLVGV